MRLHIRHLEAWSWGGWKQQVLVRGINAAYALLGDAVTRANKRRKCAQYAA